MFAGRGISSWSFGVALAAVFAQAVAFGTTYYVSPDGDGTNPTAGFSTGYAKIEDGIAAATNDGDIVLLDRATFKATEGKEIHIKKAITVSGVGEKEETIIDGCNKDYKFYVEAAGARLQNFTFTRIGSAWTANLGMKMTASGVISNVVARQNGNAYEKNANARYTFQLTSGLLTHCIITNNYAPTCPGVYLGSKATMENCYLADNMERGLAANGHGSAIEAQGGTVRNCTIVNNKGTSGAIYLGSASKVYNSIIWGNTYLTGSQVNNWNANGKGTDNWIGNQTSPVDGLSGSSNSAADPLMSADGIHFLSTSPCRGTAVTNYAAKIDMHGTLRGEKPSRGCLEYEDTGVFSCIISASAITANYPETIAVETKIDGVVTEPLEYVWDLRGDGSLMSYEAKPVLTEVGCYHPSVIVTDAKKKTTSATFASDIIIYGAERICYVTNGLNPYAKAPYASWATAATNLADAIEIAQVDSKVLLCKGIHTIDDLVEINKRITLTTVAGPIDTFLSKSAGIKSQLFKLNAIGCSVEGFTTENQSYNNNSRGSAIVIVNGGVRNCRFIRNVTCGHGMVTTESESADAFVENCLFVGNHSESVGGQGPAGVKLMGSKPRCENCLFVGNTNFAYDIAYPGGALYAASSSSIIRNCTFVDNMSRLGSAGVNMVGSSFAGTVENCIFKGNVTTNTTENTLVKSDDPMIEQYKTASRSNTPTNIVSYLLSSNSLNNCCIVASTNDYTGYTMILKNDPRFVNAEEGNYRLPLASPCVNTGNFGSWTAQDVDLDGNSRVVSRKVDMGCYECQKTSGLYLLLR